LSIFRKSAKKIQVSLKCDKKNGHVLWTPMYIFYHTRSVLIRLRNVSNEHFTENQNTFFMFHNFFYIKSYCLWDNVKKNILYSGPDHMTIWRQRIGCYKHTLRIRNNYHFSTFTVVARKRGNFTVYAHCLFSYYLYPWIRECKLTNIIGDRALAAREKWGTSCNCYIEITFYYWVLGLDIW
jgi:hypothetical protein